MGLACGGAIRIFVERAAGGVLPLLVGAVQARQRVALVTHLATGAHRVARSPGDVEPEVAPALDHALRRGRSVALEGSDGEIFINVFNPAVRLIILGAVHVAQPLVPMARALGDDVVIVDPRSAFATKSASATRRSCATGRTRRCPGSALMPAPPCSPSPTTRRSTTRH